MAYVTVKAREASFRNGTFRVTGELPVEIELHASRDSDPAVDGRAVVDRGRIEAFEFLGRTRLATGERLGFVRTGGPNGRVWAIDGALSGRPRGTTARVGYDDLDAGLPVEMPWLVAGTRVRTPEGLRPVEELQAGDLVMTRDDGPQPVRRVVTRNIGAEEMAEDPDARPIVVLAGSLGPNTPARDLRLSRRARIRLCGWRADRCTSYNGVLAPAGTLVDRYGIVPDMGSSGATLVLLEFDEQVIVLAEGVGVECSRPDVGEPVGYRMITLPELALMETCIHAAGLDEISHPARPALTGWEVAAIERERAQGKWAEALKLITVGDLIATPPGEAARPAAPVPAKRDEESLLLLG